MNAYLLRVVSDRWRNSGGSKGSSDLPKDGTQPRVRRRYGASSKPLAMCCCDSRRCFCWWSYAPSIVLPLFRCCRYGAVLPAVGQSTKKSRRQSSTSGALRYYEYTLLGKKKQLCRMSAFVSTAPDSDQKLLCGCADEGPAGEECFLFHVVNPACCK